MKLGALNQDGYFDIVIGNPPYGAKFNSIDKEYFKKTYKYQNYQPESYLLFVEKGISVLSFSGTLSYIIPNTWLSNLKTEKIRNYIFHHTIVNNIVHFINPVFEAIVDTEVIILQNESKENNTINIVINENNNTHSKFIIQSKLSDYNGKPINIFENESVSIIKKKLEVIPKLDSLCKITQGTKPFQVGKGYPKQTREIVDSKCYVSNEKKDNSFVPLLRGSLINKYTILWEQNYWISYGDWLAEPRYSANFNAQEKIVVRQTGDSIIATIDTNQFVVRDNLYTIVPIKEIPNLKFILGIINSHFINWYYQNILNSEKGEALAQVKRGHLALLPMPQKSEFESSITDLVDKILAVKKVNLQADTSSIEREIDRIVYQVYNLTEEEIEMIVSN